MDISKSNATPQPKFRKDYAAPAYWIDTVNLHLDIQDGQTDVISELGVRANTGGEWRLDGRGMSLLEIAIDGTPVDQGDYTVDDSGLTLHALPQTFTLTLKNRIEPEKNTALEGFYRSGDILTTQCESNGFSRITYFPDRPDVLARYEVKLTADKEKYPILLANGDRVAQGDADAGRHYATWRDPYPKPCYLFAAVAGDLAEIEASHKTASGREIDIRFFTDHGNENLCDHAIESLQQAMTWDERVYGLEYDLDTYMVVAVGSFNMGAMENKGLNIFNTSCILASPETATDSDFVTVRDVVAHEYFHNYTGNRVTCRDWFQLSLKESLTVFREQQFAADHDSPGVTRIEQARVVRNVQFPEDSGPTAHPVRPESYIEMNNFYTITIYQKGAEVIRMMHRILGDEAFNTAVRQYLDKHDGQAVTIEDFVVALEESSSTDLQQFRRWYSQAGTPKLEARDSFDADSGTYELTLSQQTPATPGQPDKEPFHIPVDIKLFDDAGQALDVAGQGVLHLREATQSWQFEGLQSRPVPSVLRGFSAPVKLVDQLDTAALSLLMRAETDDFARWEAAQRLFLNALITDVEALQAGSETADKSALYEAFQQLLNDPPADRALLAEMLSLPTQSYLAEQFDQIDMAAICAAHAGLQAGMGEHLLAEFEQLLEQQGSSSSYRFDPEEVGRRRLAAVSLDYLAAAGAEGIAQRCLERFQAADNMTDMVAALNALRDIDCPQREQALAEFEKRWQAQPLVLDKWFALQATSRLPNVLERVQELLEHPKFSLENPNRVRALLGQFARGNLQAFHRADGAGYRFIADQVLVLNDMNPQIAARMVSCFSQWRRHTPEHSKLMQAQLKRIMQHDNLSSDVYEMVEKILS